MKQTRPSSNLTPAQARRHLETILRQRIPRSTFYHLVEDGRIESIRIGSKILIPRHAVEAFRERCERGERY